MSRLLVLLAVLLLLFVGARQALLLVGRRFQRTPLGMMFAALREAQREASAPARTRRTPGATSPAKLRRCSECGDHVPDLADGAEAGANGTFRCERCRRRSSVN